MPGFKFTMAVAIHDHCFQLAAEVSAAATISQSQDARRASLK